MLPGLFRGLVVVAVLVALVSPVAHAAGVQPGGFNDVLDQIERQLHRGSPDQRLITAWVHQVAPIRDAAGECVANNRAQLDRIERQMNTLGEAVAGEDPEVTHARRSLAREKAAVQKQLGACRVLILRSDDLMTELGNLQQKRLAEHLFARGPSLYTLVLQRWEQPDLWLETIRGFLTRHSGIGRLSLRRWFEFGGVVLVALAVGGLVRRRLRRWSARHGAGTSFSGRFSRAVVAVYGHYVPHLLASTTAALTLFALTRGLEPVPFVSVVAYGLPVSFLLLSLVHLFLAPYRPGDTLLTLDAELARPLARRLQVLALLLFFGYLLFAILLEQSFPEPALLTSRAVFAAVFVLNLIWVLWLLGQIPRLEDLSWFRAGLTLVLLGALVVEWLGYRNLSVFILGAVVGTLLAIGLFVLFGQLLGELFDGLDEGRHSWQRQVRRFIGLKPHGPIRGLAWLRLLATLTLWLGLALVLLRIWGLSDSGVERLRSYVTDGFTVGSLTIIPARVALAILSLTLVLTVSGWIRTRMERSWLAKTRMDRGAREALVTISGYIGAATAILLALAVAGVDFGSLAIIAGALSVGIGFGLQNIVNNFVSGLILLFERPIKTGDWVVVGDTQGYVKRISIRSTQIQTFDQADVIVPNSDLISNQVTNWMLRDPRGRIIVPMGVAYGSDTEQVREIMLKVAEEHPLVINNEPLLEAKVLFRGFGDSSLNFELRCFIHYIDQLIQVTSDLNFAIDKAFREHGISIPFPQRDLHIRDWPVQGVVSEPEEGGVEEEPVAPPAQRRSDTV